MMPRAKPCRTTCRVGWMNWAAGRNGLKVQCGGGGSRPVQQVANELRRRYRGDRSDSSSNLNHHLVNLGGGKMRVDHIPCGECVNESERVAIEHLTSKLRGLHAPHQRWILLSNVPSAVNDRAIPDEIDLVLYWFQRVLCNLRSSTGTGASSRIDRPKFSMKLRSSMTKCVA